MENTEKILSISENLILKLEMSRQIFQQASEKVHNDYMKNAFSKLSLLRADFQKKLARYAGIKMENLSLNVEDKIKIEAAKLGMHLDHLLITRNEKEILGFINEQAERLIEEYELAVIEENLNLTFLSMLEQQKATIKQNYSTLKKEYEGYVYA